MAGNGGVAFIAPGTQIHILHPGGIQTRNAFGSYILEWYTKNAGFIMESSGLYEMISEKVSEVMNSNDYGLAAVREAVKSVTNSFDTGVIIK